MRILCICYEDMGGQIGGVRQVMEIGENLLLRGHQVEVSCPRIRKYRATTSLRIRYIPTISIRILRNLTYQLLSPLYILGTCLKFRPDIILTYEIFLTCIPLIMAKLIRRPYVAFVNGDIEDFEIQRCPKSILDCIDLLRKINFRFADGIVTVTEELKEIMVKRYRIPLHKITLVNNGVNPCVFKPMDKGEACRALGLDKGYFYVGFLGGLYLWHGLEALIKSAPLVLNRYPKTNFIIAGGGPMKDELIRLARELRVIDNFIFTGNVPFDLAPEYMSVFDICVVFFKAIRKNPGNPIKLFEYLACARPVIASNEGGYGDFVERYEAGMGVDSKNPQAVAEAIISLIENEDLRERMGKKGREAVVGEFTWNKTTEILESQFYRILSG